MGNVCVPIGGPTLEGFIRVEPDVMDITPQATRRDSHKVLTWDVVESTRDTAMSVAISHSTKFSENACYIVAHVNPSESNECGTMPLPVLRLLERIAAVVCADDIPAQFPSTPSERGRLCQVYVWSGKTCSSVTKAAAVSKAAQLRKYLALGREQRIARYLHRLNGYITLADALSNDPSPEPARHAQLPRPFIMCPLVRLCLGSGPAVAAGGLNSMLTIDKAEQAVDYEEKDKEITFPHASKTPRGHQRLSRSLVTISSLTELAENDTFVMDFPRPLGRSQSTGSTPGKRHQFSLSLDLRCESSDYDSEAPIVIESESDSDEDGEKVHVAPKTPKAPPRRRLPPSTPMAGAASSGPPSEISDMEKKKLKMAFFAKDCTSVNEFISVGGKLVAQDYDLLVSKGVTHVLNCVGDVCDNYHEGKLKYLKFYLLDSMEQDVTCIVYDCYRFVENARESGGRVLIHCQQGVSRSTIVTIAYLILHLSKDYDACYEIVRAARQVCRPNIGFVCQLLDWQKRLRGENDRSLILYRMASHSARDRLRIVAKWCDVADQTAMDTRTVFILRSPQTMYIWVGRGCQLPDYFLELAKRHCAYIQRFEHAPEALQIIYESNPRTPASDEFWSLVGSPSGELTTPINPAYDAEPFTPKELATLKRMLIAIRQGKEQFSIDYYRDRASSVVSLDGQFFRERTGGSLTDAQQLLQLGETKTSQS